MILDEAVALIEYAILEGQNGDIIIPKLKAMYIKDLLEIFSEKYNKPIIETGMRSGEKLYETLINDMQSLRTITNDKYYHIKPSYFTPQPLDITTDNIFEYDSKQTTISKEELANYLKGLNLDF